MHVMLVGLLLLLVVLAIPFIWKPEGRPPLNGPALDDLTYREIAFESGELRMGGMLFLPDVPGPHPLTVLIHGSGPSSRDSAWYLSIADHLQRNGIAVLLPDKRGCEQSEGDWRTASLPELAEDTVAAVAYGARLDDAAFSTIGVMGLSQGGWIAPVAATLNPEVDFVVSMSGAAVPTDEQLLHEEIHSIERMGTYHFVARLLAPLSTARLRRMDFWAPLAGFDPLPYWREVDVPVFLAFGGGDPSVPVAASAERIESLDRDWLVEVYPDGGHGISDPVTQRVQEAFLADLVDFIARAGS